MQTIIYNAKGSVSILNVIIICIMLVLLAAILFPIFARPSCGEGRKSTCANNLKQCAIAFLAYLDDYNGCIPSSAILSGSKKWNVKDFNRFACSSGEFPSDGSRLPEGWAGILYSHMKSKDILSCPADSAYYNQPDARVSYWWKAAMDKAWFGLGCKKPCRKESDFAYNADQLLLYERAGFHSETPEGLKNGVRILVAYLDSHVRSIELTNCLSENSHRLVTSPNFHGEPAYFNFDNKKPMSKTNPPPPGVLTDYVDPARYSDNLP